MAITVRVRAPAVAGHPPLPPRQSTEPEAILTALMFIMLLIGVAALALAAQAVRAPAAPNQRPIEGWVGDAPGAEPVAPPTLAPLQEAPSAAPAAPAPPPVEAAPALAGEGAARVANTAGRGVILHTEPRRGARTPAGLLEGARVTLLEREGSEWVRVRSDQGRVGWVPTAYLVPAD